jgi:hypothetical protein
MTCPAGAQYSPADCNLDSTERYCQFKSNELAEFPWPCSCPPGKTANPANNSCDNPANFLIRIELGAKTPQTLKDHDDCDTNFSSRFQSRETFLVGKYKNGTTVQTPVPYYKRGSYFNGKVYFEMFNAEIPDNKRVVIDMIFRPKANNRSLFSSISASNLKSGYLNYLGLETDYWNF